MKLKKKGLAFSFLVVMVISIILIGVVYVAGRTIAGGMLQETANMVTGVLGRESITVRSKKTMTDLLRCYMALKMMNKDKIEKYKFRGLKDTKQKGCVGFHKGPEKINFEIDLEDKNYIELGTSGKRAGFVHLKHMQDMAVIGNFGREWSNKEVPLPQRVPQRSSIPNRMELYIANGETEAAIKDNGEVSKYGFGRVGPGVVSHDITTNRVKIYDGAEGYITGYYKCGIFGSFVSLNMPKIFQYCDGVLKIMIEDQGEATYSVPQDNLIDAAFDLPEGEVVKKTQKEEGEG